MKEYFQQLQQYALKSESKVISNFVYDFMVISILATHGGKDHTLKSDQILPNIEKYFPIHNTSFSITQSLSRLTNTDKISFQSGSYTLSEKAFTEYNSDNDVQEQLEKSVKKLLEQKIKTDLGRIAEKHLDTIVCNFLNLLDKTFNAYGSHAVRLFSNDNFKLDDLQYYSGFGKLFNDEVLKLIPSSQHDQVKKSFNEFFFNPTKPLATYLNSRSIGYIIPRVINADPEFKKLSKKSLKNKQIILDTNFIMHLILKSSQLQSSLSILISQTQKLGIKVFILSITKGEFLRRLGTARDNFELRKKGEKYAVKIEDPFVDAYYKNSNFQYSFNDFVVKFEKIDSLLKNEYGIDMIEEEGLLEDLPEGLPECIASASTHIPPKTRSAQIHDAVCIEYVRQKRKETEIDETGLSSWFLTLDTTLRRAERKFYDHDVVSNISPAAWMQAISPFLGGTLSLDTTKEAFSKLISANFIVRNVKNNIFTNLLSTIPSLDNLSDETIKDMIGDQYVQELFVKLSAAQSSEDSGEQNKQWGEIQKYLNKKYEVAVKKQNEKIEEQGKKLEKQYSQITSQKKEMIEDKNMHQKEVEDLKSKIENLDSNLKEIESTSISKQNEYSKLKTTLIVVLISGVIDAISSLVLNNILPLNTVLWILLGLLGTEAIITLILLLRSHIKKNNEVPWSRGDKLALIGIVIGVIGVLLAFIQISIIPLYD